MRGVTVLCGAALCLSVAFAVPPFSGPSGGALAADSTPVPVVVDNAESELLVLALAADVPTSARMTIEVTRQLVYRKNNKRGDEIPFRSNVLPMPGWGFTEYGAACAQSDATRVPPPPALVLLPPSVQSATSNYFFGTRNWTEVQFVAVLATCSGSAVKFTWHSAQVHEGIGSINNFTLLGVAAAFAGVNAINNKSGTSSKTTVTTYPTPTPVSVPSGAPTPAQPPFVASVTDATSTGSNQNSPNGIIVGSAVLSALGSSLPSIGSTSTDRQFTVAHTKAVEALVDHIMAARRDANCPAVVASAQRASLPPICLL